MSHLRKACLLAALVSMAALVSRCGEKDTGKIKLVVWGLQSSEESNGLDPGDASRPGGLLLHPEILHPGNRADRIEGVKRPPNRARPSRTGLTNQGPNRQPCRLS